MKSRGLTALLFRGSLWSGSGKVLATGLGAVLNVLLARFLSPEDYGSYFIALSFVALAASLGTLGADQAAVRLVSEALVAGQWRRLLATVRTTMRLAAIGAVGVALLFGLFYRPLILGLFDVPALLPLWAAIGLWIMAAVLQRLIAEVFRGLQDIRLATMFAGVRHAGILSNVTLFLGVIVLYLLGASALAPLIWLSTILTVLTVAVAAVVLGKRLAAFERPALPSFEPLEIGKARMGFVLRIAGPLLIVTVLAAVRTEVDIWLVGIVASPSDVAIYGAAFRLAALIYIPLFVIAAALAPFLAEADSRGGRRALEATVRVATTTAAVPTLAAAALLAAFSGSILGFLFGDFYRVGQSILLVLIIGQLVNSLAGPNVLILSMRGEEKATMVGMLITVAYVVTVGWLLAQRWGRLGVAVASTSGLLVQNGIMAFLLRRRLGLRAHALLSPRAAWNAVKETREPEVGDG